MGENKTSISLNYIKVFFVLCLLLCLNALEASEPNALFSSDLFESPPETVFIPGGTFVMGTKIKKKRNSEYHPDEAPIKVQVHSFRIGKYPVTAKQMCRFLNSSEAKKYHPEELYNHKDLISVGSGEQLPYTTIILTDGKYTPRPNAAQSPANQVTWKGAVLFCQWLSQETGRTYRLPSEAEWEFAARGKEGRKFPWGEKIQKPAGEEIGERFSYRQDRKPLWCTVPVGSHPSNATPEGVMDMCSYIIGEWCVNKYVEHPTAKEATCIIPDPNDLTTDRVVRGYYHRPNSSRFLPFPFGERGYHIGCAWTRMHAHPIRAVEHAARYGFRVVEEINTEAQKEGDSGF